MKCIWGKQQKKINKTKNWIFEEKNKNSELLARLKKKETQINKIRNKKEILQMIPQK